MIYVSNDFRSLATKIYTFAFLCLAIKVFEPTSISQGGLKVEFAETGLIAGAFAIVTVFMVLSAVLRLISELVRSRLADDVSSVEVGQLRPDEVVPQNRRSTFAERRFRAIRATQAASFAVEALVPIGLGIIVALYASQDMVEFVQEVTS